ncbi:lyase family protein [Methylomicrobium sp. Wu6]|uniref:lyase family protein n=1 Tax=Methylomicrobium sp. Wu6 TaxID=3107928 RepID=UPI002DD6968E|nr:lyase family protein [Methylomicrobium sp. Wu6]MEC4747092.1 lyase family protein [Methylomicrobium sp. Wu6]
MTRNGAIGKSCFLRIAVIELSGRLTAIAVSLLKIANDLRRMNTEPLAGLGGTGLPALRPGSSIMPNVTGIRVNLKFDRPAKQDATR